MWQWETLRANHNAKPATAWTNAWRQTLKNMQPSAKQDQTDSGHENPRIFINIHRVLEAQEQKCPEMQNEHIIG